MIEHYTHGVVLDRRPRGELDATITIFTKELGKINTFAKSIRKITSKLSGHLQPGSLVEVRIIEKNQMQAIDALSRKPICDAKELLKFVRFLDQVIPLGEQDSSLWYLVEGVIETCRFERDVYKYLLEVIGFGGEETTCGICKDTEIASFSIPDIMFLCTECSGKVNLGEDEIIKIEKG